MKLVLIRHGETDHNVDNRMSGWTEAALSQKGIEQAKALGSRMEGMVVHRVVTSGMVRALETAALVFPQQKESMQTLTQLKEMNFGMMESLTMEQVKEQYPEEFGKLQQQAGKYTFPKGESLYTFHQRVQKGGHKLRHHPEEETIAVVAHSGTIRSLLSGWIARDWRAHWRFRIDHCSVTIIEFYEDFPVLRVCNDTTPINIV